MGYLRCSAYGILAFFCLFAAPQAQAQESRGEVFGGFLAGKVIGRTNCSSAGVTVTPCTPWGRGWNGSFAVHMSDRWSLVGTVFGLHESLDAELRLQDRSIPFSATSDTLAFAGGVRVHGGRSASVRPFLDILYGYSRTDGTVETIAGRALPATPGDDLAVGSSMSSSMLMPGVGVDLAVADRVAVRFQSHLPFLSELRLGAGLVFAIGN